MSETDPTFEQEDVARDLTTGALSRDLVAMSAPMMLGALAMVAMPLVDTIFLGRLGASHVAAISFAFPVIFIIDGILNGLGEGATNVLSHAVGGEQQRPGRLTTQSLLLGIVAATVLVLAGFPLLAPTFRLLGASQDVMPLILEYMTIWLLGAWIYAIPVLATAGFRARGDSMTPMYLMLGGAIINAVLDPLLIFGLGPFPAMGIGGAATATVFAKGATAVLALWLLIRAGAVEPIGRETLQKIRKVWKKVLGIGIPAATMTLLIQLGIGIVTRITSSYGVAAVAAFGAGQRVWAVALVLFQGLATGLGPVAAQSWGAGLRDRVRSGLRLCQKVAVGWAVFCWASVGLGASWLARFFVDDPSAAGYLELYFQVTPAGLVGVGVLLVCGATLNAIDRAPYAAAMIVAWVFLLLTPTTWLGSHYFGVLGIFGGIAVSDTIIGLITFIITERLIATTDTKSEQSPSPDPESNPPDDA